MIGGGISKKSRRSKYASSYDGKSPEEIQKVKKARDREKAKARMKTPQNRANDRARKKTAREKYKTRNIGVALMELYSVVCPIEDNDSVQFSHMALEDVKMTWAVFLYYMTNVKSYNELQWKEDYLRPMIPSWNKDRRMHQIRKFNGISW